MDIRLTNCSSEEGSDLSDAESAEPQAQTTDANLTKRTEIGNIVD